MINFEKPVAFFDLETTSAKAEECRIVQIAIVKVMPDMSRTIFKQLVNPGCPIPAEATAVHHITDEMVADMPHFKNLAATLLSIIDGCDLAGFNSNRFDIAVLASEFDRTGVEWDFHNHRQIDMFKIFTINEGRKLADAVQFYCGRPMRDGAHDALVDVEETIEVFIAQMERYPDLPKDMAELELYCNDGKAKIDPTGKFVYNADGDMYFQFGKHIGKKVKDNIDYIHWMVGGTFGRSVKEVCRRILAKTIKI